MLIKRKKLAEILDKTEASIRVQECRGEMPEGWPPALRVGRCVRYDMHDVQAYIDGLRAKASAREGR